MSYYRIKIDELNNGEKRYTPQFSRLIISGKWIKKTEIVWYNFSCGSFTEEINAINHIQSLRKLELKQKGKEVKSTTYKNID
jgi:hypothetical protein